MTPATYLIQCPSENPWKEEKNLRFPNKILDSSQLLSSTLNITQEGCKESSASTREKTKTLVEILYNWKSSGAVLL